MTRNTSVSASWKVTPTTSSVSPGPLTNDGRFPVPAIFGCGTWKPETASPGVVSAAFSADHRRAFSCDWRGGIRVWDVAE